VLTPYQLQLLVAVVVGVSSGLYAAALVADLHGPMVFL
jgi:hypothetical protein